MGDNPSATTDPLKKIFARRKHSRVAVGPKNRISAVLKGKPYPVSDISEGGIRIQCPKSLDLAPDQVIDDCELFLSQESVKPLTGRLVYSSGGSGPKQNKGIQWINLPEKSLKKIAAHVSRVKQVLNQAQDQEA